MTSTTANLMPTAFLVVAGHEAVAAENASRAAHVKPSRFDPSCADSQSLIRWQCTEGRRFRSVELVSSIYGWSVRASSGLDGFALLAGRGQLDGSMADAVRWAREWVAQEADRYAYVRTYELTDADRAAINPPASLAAVGAAIVAHATHGHPLCAGCGAGPLPGTPLFCFLDGVYHRACRPTTDTRKPGYNGRPVTVFEDGSDDYTGEDDLTERAIENRNDEYASRQTALDEGWR